MKKRVDWKPRDTVQARLRKYGYPPYLREQVAERMVEIAKHDATGEET